MSKNWIKMLVPGATLCKMSTFFEWFFYVVPVKSEAEATASYTPAAVQCRAEPGQTAFGFFLFEISTYTLWRQITGAKVVYPCKDSDVGTIRKLIIICTGPFMALAGRAVPKDRTKNIRPDTNTKREHSSHSTAYSSTVKTRFWDEQRNAGMDFFFSIFCGSGFRIECAETMQILAKINNLSYCKSEILMADASLWG